MDDTICHCSICRQKHPESDMHLRNTDVYPYKRKIYLCALCNEKRERLEALKAAKSDFKNPSRSSYCFKY